MGSEIAYPSEIIDTKEKSKSLDPKAAVWIRFLARMCDYSLMYLALYIFQKYVPSTPMYVLYYFPSEYLFFIPFESIFLRVAKATPGKLLLGVRVEKRGRPLPLKDCFQRSWKVYFRGMGLGIFWIYLFSMSIAYSALLHTGKTAWDYEQKSEVKQKAPVFTNVLAAIFFILFVFFFQRSA